MRLAEVMDWAFGLYELKQSGYKGTIKYVEWKNEAPSYNYNIPVTIKHIWAIQPEIYEKNKLIFWRILSKTRKKIIKQIYIKKNKYCN